MQYAANDAALDAPARQPELCLGAFIAYEDVATGKRAKETCDVLTRQLGSDWQIEIEMSSFDSLHVPESTAPSYGGCDQRQSHRLLLSRP